MSDIFAKTLEALDAALAEDAAAGNCELTMMLMPYIEAIKAKNYDKCLEYWHIYGDYAQIAPIVESAPATFEKKVDSVDTKRCMYCGGTSLIYDSERCDRICTTCGMCIYDSEIRPVGFMEWETKDCRSTIRIVKYSRIVNMKSILRNLQGYPSPLKPEVKELISELRPCSDMTISKLRLEFRRRKIKVSLDMCPSILEIINPTFKPLRLSKSQETLIIGEFFRITKVFKLLQDEGKIKRKNFLSYHFILSKIIVRRKIGSFVRKFLILPKCETTKVKQQRDWRKIRDRYLQIYSISNVNSTREGSSGM